MGPLLSISFPRTLLRQMVHHLGRIADSLERAYPPPQYTLKDIHEPEMGRFDMAQEAKNEQAQLEREWALEQARHRREIKLNKREDS